jgi:hypothetical protein
MDEQNNVAQGSTADHCTRWPNDGHSMVVHMRGGAQLSVKRCGGCGWIDFADLDEQVRSTRAAAAERAAWTRDIARMLRDATGVAAELRPGYLAAAEWLDPSDGTPVREDPAAHAFAYRLGEQREALHAAREIYNTALKAWADGTTSAFDAKDIANIKAWMDRFNALADPPMEVEVEEDDDADDADDEPTTEGPHAGVSAGRWQPISPDGVVGGAAHLDFAEDAARRARERDRRCVNDTNGDGDCPACARNPDASCRQVSP